MKVISVPALHTWLDALAREKVLIAPKEEAGVLLYRRVGKAAEITFPGKDALRPVTPIKEAFFPSTERLLLIERHGAGQYEVHPTNAGYRAMAKAFEAVIP